MTLSMVIPCYSLNPELLEAATMAALSYREQVDELIIVEDGGMYSKELMEVSDIYIYSKKNEGFTKSVNRGWKISSGDFTAIVNSDTFHFQGNLKDLCIRGKVTSPFGNQYAPYLWGSFFVVPKEITEQRGYLLEDMKIFASDSEYDNRVRDIYQMIPSVEIIHEGSKTVKAAKIDEGNQQFLDGTAYQKLKDEGKAK